ncbi:MAG: NAD(P)/FAD-dependent oxidoreductase [Candidatus Kapaibacterium sp.]|nr:MAG: NAD(P)/FAD-dependent oxidoreductase [Candidatus Kapabacteria bacterium]
MNTSKHNHSEQQFDVVIIGAGAAGLMCAIEAGKRGRRVLVLEHAEKIGKKILISGGGRCNFTNITATPRNYLSENPHFCKSALARYTPHDFLALVEKHGIPYHEKKLGQLFCDNSSRDIVQMLERECEDAKVEIRINTHVQAVSRPANTEGFCIQTSPTDRINTQSLVIATGGLSIPKMGATDFGYRIATQFGVPCTAMKPALVPFTFANTQKESAFGEISGVALDAYATCNDAEFRENVLFTHRGVSGPAILQISSYWNSNDSITLNTAPHLDFAALWEEHRASPVIVKNVLSQHLPKRFVEIFCQEYAAKIAFTSFSNLSRKDYDTLATTLSAWKLVPNGTEGYAKAEVTAGGISTDALSSKTMEAKAVRGLYFIGEVVDVTGWLGGYNFQWAWASGVAAGQSA